MCMLDMQIFTYTNTFTNLFEFISSLKFSLMFRCMVDAPQATRPAQNLYVD